MPHQCTASGRRSCLLTAVDSRLSKLLGAWLLHISAAEADIVKTFELQLPAGAAQQPVQKRVSVDNPYPTERRYRLKSSDERLLSLPQSTVRLEANSAAPVQLVFRPANRPGVQNVS